MIIALTLITIALLALWLVSYLKDDSDLLGFVVVSLIIVAFVGWGICAGALTSFRKPEPALVTDILRGKHIIVVSTICDDSKENNTIFKDNEVDVINPNTKFYWEVNTTIIIVKPLES